VRSTTNTTAVGSLVWLLNLPFPSGNRMPPPSARAWKSGHDAAHVGNLHVRNYARGVVAARRQQERAGFAGMGFQPAIHR